MVKEHRTLGPLWLKHWEARNEKVYDYDIEADLLSKSFGANQSGILLSLGCGTAPYLRRLAPLGFKGVGVDIDGSLIEMGKALAAQSSYGIEFVQADVRELPNIGKFDAAFAMHLTFPRNEWRNILRKVKPQIKRGGLFCAGFVYSGTKLQADSEGITSCVLFEENNVVLLEVDHYYVQPEAYSCGMILIEESDSIVQCEKHATDVYYFESKEEMFSLLMEEGYFDVHELNDEDIGLGGLRATLVRSATS